MRCALVCAARLQLPSVFPRAARATSSGKPEVIPATDDMRGVVSEPSSWQNLKEKIEENTVESLGTLGRTTVDIEVYREFRRQKLQEWDGMGSYLYNKIWGWQWELNQEGKKTVKIPDSPSTAPIWIANDFPYACQPGIEHHNIWCTRPLSEDEIWAVIEKHRPEVEGWENLMFVNPVELQSVRAIWHAHVLSRKAPEKE